MTYAIINDLIADNRITLYLTSDDFKALDELWEKEDSYLKELQGTELFKGRLSWSQLEPVHFRVILMSALAKVGKLSIEQRNDDDDPTMNDLFFLVAGLVRCLASKTGAEITIIRFNRVKDNEVLYDFSAEVNMLLEYDATKPSPKAKTPPSKNGFRIVHDSDSK